MFTWLIVGIAVTTFFAVKIIRSAEADDRERKLSRRRS
jgi:hypothetical protein